MKRSIVEVNMPQHYRDSSLSSLDSVFSSFSDLIDDSRPDNVGSNNQQPQQHQQSYHTTIDYCPSDGDTGSCGKYITMQDEYDSSTKQPTPGRTKLARIVAKTSPEISALCRKSYPPSPVPPLSPQVPPAHRTLRNHRHRHHSNSNTTSGNFFNTSSDDENPKSRYLELLLTNTPSDVGYNASPHDPYNLSSSDDDSSNFSMSSSSMESVSYHRVNRTSSTSTWATYEDPPFQATAPSTVATASETSIRNRARDSWMFKTSSCGNNTLRTAASTASGTNASVTTSSTAPRPAYVNCVTKLSSSKNTDSTNILNYSGSDMELETITASLNTIQLYYPEPRPRRDSASSFYSEPSSFNTTRQVSTMTNPTYPSGSGSLSQLGRPSLHRRLSYDHLPTPEMIMYESFPLHPTDGDEKDFLLPPPPPPLYSSASCDMSPSVDSSRRRSSHRRNTTQIIMPPLNKSPLVS